MKFFFALLACFLISCSNPATSCTCVGELVSIQVAYTNTQVATTKGNFIVLGSVSGKLGENVFIKTYKDKTEKLCIPQFSGKCLCKRIL